MEQKNAVPWLRLAALIACIAGGIVLLRVFGLTRYLSLDNLRALSDTVRGLGWIGPAAYVALWVAACLFFLPGLPVTILGAVVFGAAWGAVYVTVGANLGALAAFLVARYAARSLVEQWSRKHPMVRRIDEGVGRHGWRMVMITRLVPVFPFNLQNYAYGLTRVSLGTYAGITFLCMIPGTLAYCFAAGAIVSGQGSVRKTLFYLGVAAVFFVAASLIPGWIKKRYGVDPARMAETPPEDAPG